ncbi:hypothetical protein [Amycolatopsis viridis]|uniref:Uncharacterized protein n=1 Tax=Amycolatopsis viridis TaxID=185678 RepID=A0ABX0SVH3_9PSEU|nr:hypothetical protein [Amycolatopsis viridis]NIH80972.1 hypothetical protein [Amycolatopsis viridis]
MNGRIQVRVRDGIAVARCYRRTVCGCGRRQRRLQVFGTPLHDATGVVRPRRDLRRVFRAQARAWQPDRTCDVCARRTSRSPAFGAPKRSNVTTL